MRLEHKVAIITGGARGIGKETALTFVEEGATVVIGDVMEAEGKEVAAHLEEAGDGGLFIRTDVTARKSVENMVNKTIEKFNRIDILVNNAGITSDSTLVKMTEEEWDQVIDVNMKGTFNCVQATASIMINQESGKIINASSIGAIYGNFGQTNYVASKAGIIGMTKVWARELGPKGITVNAVAPGFIETELTEKVPEKIATMMKKRTPLGRLGKPEDVAKAYLFLASDEANFINGIVLRVDGGLVP